MSRMNAQQRREFEFTEDMLQKSLTYHARLLDAFEETQKFNFTMVVRDRLFIIKDSDGWGKAVWEFSLTHTAYNEDQLTNLLVILKEKEVTRKKELRLKELKESALAKLTFEELEALGLK